MRHRFHALLALVLGLLAAAVLADAARAASAWPTRPVKLILTLGAGSGSDIGARLFADRLSRKWGQPVIVENRPGGDGLVAINAFVTAHDDHVLLFAPPRRSPRIRSCTTSCPTSRAISFRSCGCRTPSSSSPCPRN